MTDFLCDLLAITIRHLCSLSKSKKQSSSFHLGEVTFHMSFVTKDRNRRSLLFKETNNVPYVFKEQKVVGLANLETFPRSGHFLLWHYTLYIFC